MEKVPVEARSVRKVPLPCAIAVLALATGSAAVPQQSPLEYPLKAAFLYNLVKFVEWPAADGNGPIVLGILGRDAFGATVEQIFRGKEVDGRALQIRYVAKPEDLKFCQAIFIPESEQGRLPEILAALKDAHVLTVSEIERFAERGGMVRLIVEHTKVRLEVNVDTVSRARLKISARLLQLASVVRDRDRRNGK